MVQPCTATRDDHDHEDDVEQACAPSHARQQRDDGEVDRHRAAQPDPGDERRLAQRPAERQQARQTPAGRATRISTAATASAGSDLAAASCGVTSRPSIRNSAICASQPSASKNRCTGSRPGARGCRRSRPRGRRRGSRWRPAPAPPPNIASAPPAPAPGTRTLRVSRRNSAQQRVAAGQPDRAPPPISSANSSAACAGVSPPARSAPRPGRRSGTRSSGR